MRSLFYYCSQLSSVDSSSFDTSNVVDIAGMFFNNSKLTSIDLSNFNTSKVRDMIHMFVNCSQLTSLNLSNFDTSHVKDMNRMFEGCSKLSSLNLSNFDTLQVTNMSKMFNGCSNLEYINLKNFNENINLNVDDIFYNIPDKIVVCLNGVGNKIKQEILKKSNYRLDCSDNWKIELIDKADVCFNYSNNGILYKYEYQGKYYENLNNENLTNNSPIKYCQCDKEKCISCSNISSFIDLEEVLYEIEDNDNSNLYRKCYKDPVGYYLDIKDNIYKKCFYSCEKCEMNGNNINHNCIECNNNYPIEFRVKNYFNCYRNCSYYYYFDIYNNYHCTVNNICPDEYPLLDGIKCKLGNKIKNVIQDLINNEENKKEEIKYYDTILKNIEDIYTSKQYNTSYFSEGNDEIIEMEKMKVILTTTENQKNNINSDTTTLDLGECEKSLRQAYNLTDNDTIYIKMLEISQEEMKIPKVEYDIYAKLNGENLEKLSLNSCKNNKISLLIPINNVDNIDKLNSKSGYYNDFCYTTTSDSGTDITLEDRKNEYPSNAACQDGCDFADYNHTLKKAKCSCNAKESSSSFKDMKIDKNKLLDNFKDIKNIANIKLLKCVKVLFSKKGISENVGFYIFSSIIIFHAIILIVFYKKKLSLLLNKIKLLIFAKNYLKSKNSEIKEKKEEIIKIDFKNKKYIKKNIIRLNEVNDNNIINDDNNFGKIQIKKKRIKKTKKNRYKFIKKEKEPDINSNNSGNRIKINLDNSNNKITDGNNKKEFENPPKKDEIKKLESMMDYTEDELNDLSYELALKIDKRTYWQLYQSLIKTKHEFIYAFLFNEDYNSKIIKIDLFVFGFGLNYVVNGLFFNDDTMHNVYESKGVFDVSYQLPLIVYSSFISMFLGSLVQMLGLSNDAISDFKQSEEIDNIDERGKKLIKKLKIKFVFYFILSFILLIAFWYYISMFNAVYRNTQYFLLKDTIMGFALSMVTPFIIYLIPGIFRISALAVTQENKRCLYNFSKQFTIL